MRARDASFIPGNNSSSLCRRSTLDAASCCHPRFTVPGSNSSGSRSGGLSPAANALHDGGSNPCTPTNSLAVDAASPKIGVMGNPSNSVIRAAATSGFRAWIIGRQSDQLAQNAGTRDRIALRNPSPPRDSGMPAASLTVASHWAGSMCRMLERHCHNPASCALANPSTAEGCTTRNW